MKVCPECEMPNSAFRTECSFCREQLGREIVEAKSGWHPDKTNPQIERYWDGKAWTGRVRVDGEESVDRVSAEEFAEQQELSEPDVAKGFRPDRYIPRHTCRKILARYEFLGMLHSGTALLQDGKSDRAKAARRGATFVAVPSFIFLLMLCLCMLISIAFPDAG